MAQGSGRPALAAPRLARAIRITGVVQGVGFRPFVFRLADRYGIGGWVRNTSSGVEIRAEGTRETLDAFAVALRNEAPPLAKVESLDVADAGGAATATAFEIVASRPDAQAYQLVSPDIATCPDCLREVREPRDRRYRYPFTNCTNCGPRFTIIRAMPYDRPNTIMAGFQMCPACQAEYDDPRNRRFHAQPNACPVCGPHVTLTDASGAPLAERDDAVRGAARALADGRIVAVKGLGGYQLACDATDEAAVALLRERKRRPHKAFAVMVPDLSAAEALCDLTGAERDLLTRSSAPIVLSRARPANGIAAAVAPGLDTLGIVLPYTPLHHVLMGDVGRPLVMTSGNLAEEPIAQDNDEALARLGALADRFLMHDRPVHSRYDDSVWFAPADRPQPVRRARGDAPDPVRLAEAVRPVLALGPEQKATFCLARDRYAFVSQHIGDMEHIETLEHHARTLALYRALFKVNPERVACDLHPDYHTTGLAARIGLPVVRVQHHHAHLASVLAENGVTTPAIGVIWDGTGYGLDGRIWGGEFLVGDAHGFVRAAHIEYLPLPGGDAATRHPYRIAWAYLATLLGAAAADAVPLEDGEQAVLSAMLAGGARVQHTSSMGRLFDAVAALLGVRRTVTYEAQAAVELEALARQGALARDRADDGAYPWSGRREPGVLRHGQTGFAPDETTIIGVGPLFEAILGDKRAGVSAAEIARRFHATTAAMLVATCRDLAASTGLDTVALSGGVFQNRLLLEMVLPALEAIGLRPLLHRQVPANDGGVSLGQAWIAHCASKDSLER